MEIDLGDLGMNYELEGSGDCVVLIHGFSDNIDMWHNQFPVFSKKYQVLAYDFRGHGRTRTPDGEVTLTMHFDDLSGLLDALEIERPAIVGYSMGGRIALEFAMTRPERIAGLVMANMAVPKKGLQMSGKQAELTGKHFKMVTRLSETRDMDALADELVAKSLSQSFQDRRPDVCLRYKEIKKQNDPKHYPALIQAMIKSMASPPDLTRVTCPTLLIAGEHDPFMNQEILQAMQTDIDQVELSILPTGHASAIEAPEAFNAVVLSFLESLFSAKNEAK